MIIQTLILDVDGTLTDGRQNVGEDGRKLFKSFHCRDKVAIRDMVARGIRVIVASEDGWRGAAIWAGQADAEFVETKNKLAMLEGLDISKTAIATDSLFDLPTARAIVSGGGLFYAPSDADYSVITEHGVVVLPVQGGRGVAAAINERIK